MSIEFTLELAKWGTEDYHDVTPYLKDQGFKWSRNDVDAPGSGRDTQDALMHRKRVAIKQRYDLTCKPLTQYELSTLLTLIKGDSDGWMAARAYDPETMTKVVKKMYISTVPATFFYDDGLQQYWTGVAFNMIEQ